MKKFYIGERCNPQLSKSYYIAYGKITKKQAIAAEDCAYGSMTLTPYEKESDYLAEIQRLTESGYRVSTR